MTRPDDIVISGWSHSRFGVLDASLEELAGTAAREAVQHAGLDPEDVDEIILATYNGGLQDLAFPSGLPALAVPQWRFTPAVRVENACATGSAGVHAAVRSLRSGAARTVLVVGVEKMTGIGPSRVGRALLGADYERAGSESTTGFAEIFAEVAIEYFARYGDQADVLARIAAKSHANALPNPYAHLRKDLDVDFCATPSERNPLVAPPLRRTDCSPVSDGAAALVLTTAAVAPRAPVRIAGIAQSHDLLDARQRDLTGFEGARRAWQGALDAAGVSLDDLDFAEVHDCFTIAELLLYEAMGLAPSGQGRIVVDEGWALPGGRFPVNPSGGLKSKGHPVGATGVSQHVLVAMQLAGVPVGVAVPGARRAGVLNMGGLAVANYASILEAA